MPFRRCEVADLRGKRQEFPHIPDGRAVRHRCFGTTDSHPERAILAHAFIRFCEIVA